MQIQSILGYFWAIFRLYKPPASPPFLHILDPPLTLLLLVWISLTFDTLRVIKRIANGQWCA